MLRTRAYFFRNASSGNGSISPSVLEALRTEGFTTSRTRVSSLPPHQHFYQFYFMRVARIELASLAWEARVLPLNYTRMNYNNVGVGAWEARVLPLNYTRMNYNNVGVGAWEAYVMPLEHTRIIFI